MNSRKIVRIEKQWSLSSTYWLLLPRNHGQQLTEGCPGWSSSTVYSLIQRTLAKRCWARVLLSLLSCRTSQNVPVWNDHRAIHHASFHSVLLSIAPVFCCFETKFPILVFVSKDLPSRKIVKQIMRSWNRCFYVTREHFDQRFKAGSCRNSKFRKKAGSRSLYWKFPRHA